MLNKRKILFKYIANIVPVTIYCLTPNSQKDKLLPVHSKIHLSEIKKLKFFKI